MKENEFIEQHLKSITQVDAPPFLLTRIEAKINSNKREIVSTKKVAITIAFTIALILGNVFFIQKATSTNTDTPTSLFDSMSLVKTNQLYHD